MCFENTGFYGHLLAQWSVENKYNTWMADSLDIKKSLGLVRGKNDRIDALRIALYAYRFEDKKQLWKPSNETICCLQHLSTTRDRYLRVLNQLTIPVKEVEGFVPSPIQKSMQTTANPIIKATKKSLELVEKQIKKHIKQDRELTKMHETITSVQGVGNQLAINIILATQGGQRLHHAKAMACYAGVALLNTNQALAYEGEHEHPILPINH